MITNSQEAGRDAKVDEWMIRAINLASVDMRQALIKAIVENDELSKAMFEDYLIGINGTKIT